MNLGHKRIMIVPTHGFKFIWALLIIVCLASGQLMDVTFTLVCLTVQYCIGHSQAAMKFLTMYSVSLSGIMQICCHLLSCTIFCQLSGICFGRCVEFVFAICCLS